VNDRVSVLADSAQDAAQIDAAGAERERAKAEEEMKTAGVDTLDQIRRRLELATARLEVSRRPA
jgi:F0F1-type ATP synthase epsilon subunit